MERRQALVLANARKRALNPLVDIGSGPWAVLPGCFAEKHNTLRVAKLRIPVRCTCPHAMALLKEHHRRGAMGKKERSMAYGSVNGLPGGGPWLIKPDCPGLLHNTQNAAMKGARHLRCVCPRALALKRVALDGIKTKRAEQRTVAVAANSTPGRGTAPTYIANVRDDVGPFPSLPTGGLCQSARGREIVDLYFAEKPGATAVHRMMCARCPLREKCAAMVLRMETPAGAWGGMYAGMDVADRRKAGVRRAARKHGLTEVTR